MHELIHNKNIPRTVIILPCYNEEKRINSDSIYEFLNLKHDVKILFVNDGSTDSTQELIEKIVSINAEKMSAIRLDKNLGKAEAIRFGVSHIIKNFNNISFIAYLDSDLSTPLNEIPRLINLALIENPQVTFISGIRLQRAGSIIQRNYIRHIISRLFSTFSSLLLKLDYYDTQCGCKIFDIQIGKEIFLEKFLTRWLFDIEIYLRMRKKNMEENVIEIPLTVWKETSGSKIKIIDFLLVPLLIIKLFFFYK